MSQASPTWLCAQLFSGGIHSAHRIALLLAAIESDEILAPRRWGPAASLREPYDRAAVLAHIERRRPSDWVVVLRRAQPVELTITIVPGPLTTVTLVATGSLAEHAAALCEAVDRIAPMVELEIGCVDVRFADQPPLTFTRSSGGLHVGAYLEWGLPTVFPRTYFGERLLALLGGIDVLELSGGVSRPLAPGTVALDLLPDPWTADPAALKRAQVRVEKALRLTGIVARQAGKWRTIAAPRWVPPVVRTDDAAR